LEEWLGAALFHRTTRKLNLTEAGLLFFERTRGILLDLEEAKITAAKLEDQPSGMVRLSLPASFERRFTDAVGDFQSQWPQVSLVVSFTDRLADMIEEGFDLAVRIGALEDSTLRARKIAESRRYLCASPAYLDRFGAPRHPKDLADHNCLIFKRHPGYNLWCFRGPGGIHEVRASGRFIADSGYALVNAALAGLGIILAPEWLVGRALARKDLVGILPNFSPVPHCTPLHVVHPYQRFVPPKVKVLADFLANRYGKNYDWAKY
jgi:DNA-binding transcriptional LysR family regulator